MNSSNPDYKDLDVKFGSKEEKYWQDVKEKAEDMIEQMGREIYINTAIIRLAQEKIAKEKKTFK